MTYDPDQPAQSDAYYLSSGVSAQSSILENFSQANTVYAVDHVAFNATDDTRGLHKAVRFLDNTIDPDTSAGYSVLYTKPSSGNYVPWFRQKDNGVALPLTDAGSLTWGIYTTLAAVIFDAISSATYGSPKNIASVGPRVTSGSTYTWAITFTTPVPANSPFVLFGEKYQYWLSAYSTTGCTVQSSINNLAGKINLIILGGTS